MAVKSFGLTVFLLLALKTSYKVGLKIKLFFFKSGEFHHVNNDSKYIMYKVKIFILDYLDFDVITSLTFKVAHLEKTEQKMLGCV